MANSEKDVGQFVAMLAAATKGDNLKIKVEIYTQHLKNQLKDVDLTKLFNQLVRNHTFFPSIKEIMDLVDPPGETRREKATAFVDQMIALLQGRENIWEVAGRDNYNFWKKEIGVFRADLAQIKPQFHRNEWIDRIERAYVKYDIEQLETLEAKKETPMIEGEV